MMVNVRAQTIILMVTLVTPPIAVHRFINNSRVVPRLNRTAPPAHVLQGMPAMGNSRVMAVRAGFAPILLAAKHRPVLRLSFR